jgi:hypothetical protein
MGKTVESYRMALEAEIHRWDGFARALRKEDREAFEEMMDMCRSYAMASSNATNPIVFEPMIMSMVLFLQRRINQLEKQLSAIYQQANGAKSEDPLRSNQPLRQIQAEVDPHG